MYVHTHTEILTTHMSYIFYNQQLCIDYFIYIIAHQKNYVKCMYVHTLKF